MNLIAERSCLWLTTSARYLLRSNSLRNQWIVSFLVTGSGMAVYGHQKSADIESAYIPLDARIT